MLNSVYFKNVQVCVCVGVCFPELCEDTFEICKIKILSQIWGLDEAMPAVQTSSSDERIGYKNTRDKGTKTCE